jgi:hypothetical protein
MNNSPDKWYEAVVLPHSRLASRLQQKTFIISIGVLLIALNLYSPAEPTVTQRLLASLIIILAAVPMVLCVSGKEHGIPFMPFFTAIYAAYYALPIFVLEKFTIAWYLNRPIPDSFLEQALILALAGLGFLFVGYYIFAPRALPRIVPKLNLRWEDYASVRLFAILIGIVGVSVYYIKSAYRFPLALDQVIYFITDFSLFSIAILLVLQHEGRIGLFGKSLLWIVILPMRVLLGLATGLSWQGIQVILLIFLTYTTLKHRVPWKALVVGGIALLLSRPVQDEFRALTWTGTALYESPAAKADLYLGTAWEFVTGEVLLDTDVVQPFVSRLAHLMMFAEVIEATPTYVPFWEGETYYPLLFKPIPRFLYPDKPEEITGQTFGHRYGFISEGDDSTSNNLPQLVEFYVNFGAVGVLVGMFLIGVCIFIHSGMGLGAVVGSIYIFTQLLSIESAFSSVFGGLFWQLIFLGLLNFSIKLTERDRVTDEMRVFKFLREVPD